MTKDSLTKTVLEPLAAGLAQLPWTVWEIDVHLTRRLPVTMKKTPAALARALCERFPARVAPDAGRISEFLGHCPAAAPLRVFARRTGARAEFPLDAPAFCPAPAFAERRLPELASPHDLAEWLALSPEQLARFSDLKGLSAATEGPFARHYRHHLIPKHDGMIRLLEEPRPLLKRLQRRVLHGMLNLCPAHEAAYGFCPGRNAAMAAARHAGEAMVVCFDLSAFFPGIAHHRVYALFRRMGYPAAVARHLTGLTTALTPPEILGNAALAARDALSNRHLPQGAPTSPALANLVAHGLDLRLDGLANQIGATYTRYADDLTFSGDPGIAATLARAVRDIVEDCGFTLNPAKTRAQHCSGRQTVTGIVVNQHLNLSRPGYDRLKAGIHRLSRPDAPERADPAHLARLHGRITWLEQLNPGKGAKLRERLARALEAGE